MSGRVLITGAAGGIGRALVAAFADEGWRVAALDRVDPDPEGPADLRVTADVTDTDDVAAAARQIGGAWGGLDALVNNAALAPARRDLAAHTDDAFGHILDVNVVGAMRMVHGLRPLLQTGSHPGIVNLSSIGAARAFRRNPAYCASKGAVEALTRSLALDLAPEGIRVNAVAPGMVRTHAWQTLDDAEARRRDGIVPLGRPASAEEVASVVRFLAGAGARYVTGAVVPVDGGLAAQAYSAPEEPGLSAVGDYPSASEAP
ncbi:SDR family NAD(P)-dependent oxidoreductase [Streptomonospora litoralis]|uniref:Diacetyl reductase [(S)-acetoin forming] n=1 Tax=Streptomonospora litoralis TaxID=2498135 RepID=A0A4P6PZ57_9ACTN|nr:SDR family oxidoreductase [Streptomonospora litoralis]QBI53020.1 Diacetyl reductase [(S)-acetoin forming] [Streptomonospora litoralis]